MIHKGVQDMYLLDPENRRLSNLFLPKKLDRYLSKWVGVGVYSDIFDNVEDSSVARPACNASTSRASITSSTPT